jgi:hypothetical protein
MEQTMIELVLVFGLGWWLGSLVGQALQRMAFLKILEDLGVSPEQMSRLRQAADPEAEPEQETCEIRLEQHGDQIYAYRKSDEHFLGQAADRERLLERLKSEFSGEVKLIIREEDGANLIKNG